MDKDKQGGGWVGILVWWDCMSCIYRYLALRKEVVYRLSGC